jgi:hypothetical protein
MARELRYCTISRKRKRERREKSIDVLNKYVLVMTICMHKRGGEREAVSRLAASCTLHD